ncbi:MAG: hypothetical protein AB1640_16100 [bacterium]
MSADSGQPAGAVPRRRSRRQRFRRSRSHERAAAELPVRATELARVLAAAAQDALAEMFGPRADLSQPFPLELRVLVEPGSPWKVSARTPLEEQIRAAVREMATRADAYRYGRVYCYRCETCDCTHALPASPTTVFGGYSSTGVPQWQELSQVLLDLHHAQVDLLYSPLGQELVAVFMDAAPLKQRQLNVFGKQSKTYDILGQVVFGFLELLPPTATPRKLERVAFTLQAVESRRPDGSARLELNVLGRFNDGSSAMDSLTLRPHNRRILNILLDGRQRLAALAPRSTARPSRPLPIETVPRAEEILKRMARALERAGRQTFRRTAHAEERRADRRPTFKALEDVAGASAESVLWDAHRSTIVVLGPRNRVHVFSPEGRHVTTLVLESEEVRSRMRRGRWQPLAGEGLVRFRARACAAGESASENGPPAKPKS